MIISSQPRPYRSKLIGLLHHSQKYRGWENIRPREHVGGIGIEDVVYISCIIKSDDSTFLAAAIFFALSHSIPSVKGTAMHTMASVNIIVRMIAKFQIERRVTRSSNEDTDLVRFVGPAARIVAADSLGSLCGISFIKVPRVIVWPIAIDIALRRLSKHITRTSAAELHVPSKLPGKYRDR